MNISISSKTRNLLHSLAPDVSTANNQITLLEIIETLQSFGSSSKRAMLPSMVHKQHMQFLINILEDIRKNCTHMISAANADLGPTSHSSSRWGYWLSFAALLIIGCESFDGIASILGLFALNPWITLIVACGVCIGATLLNKLLNMIASQEHYLEQQSALIHDIAVYLEDLLNTNDNPNLTDFKELLKFLNDAQQIVNQELLQLKLSKKHIARKAAQYAITGFLSTIIFCGGFFTGQAVAFFIAGLFVATAATAWPVLIPAVCIGLLAATLYIVEQYPTIKNAIRHWFGFSVEGAEHAASPKHISQKLNVLESRMKREQQRADQATHITALEQELAALRRASGQPTAMTGIQIDISDSSDSSVIATRFPSIESVDSSLVENGFFSRSPYTSSQHHRIDDAFSLQRRDGVGESAHYNF